MELLAGYLAAVERGLSALPRRRRRELLRELEASLLDEAESLGLASEEALAATLREKEAPADLARELLAAETDNSRHRRHTKLLAGAAIGLATGGYLFILGLYLDRPWRMSLSIGLALGLAVGVGIFWLRSHWQRVHPAFRVLLAMGLGTLLATPMGFAVGHTFHWTWLSYGTFAGYLVERFQSGRRLPGWIMDNLAFTALLFALVTVQQRHWFLEWTDWQFVLRSMLFNLVLQAGVWGGLHLHRLLDGHWLLKPNRA
ncbi:MAG TPA: hypothetical protein VFM16_02215 [Holophagaceae bacterium]|nr:hypothetical protein [Holophagaceae bacterium]